MDFDAMTIKECYAFLERHRYKHPSLSYDTHTGLPSSCYGYRDWISVEGERTEIETIRSFCRAVAEYEKGVE